MTFHPVKPFMQSYPLRNHYPTKEVVVSRQLDSDGSVHVTKELRLVTDPFNGLDARSFELDAVIAAGAIDLLKQVSPISSSNLDQLDSIDSHIEHLANVKSNLTE